MANSQVLGSVIRFLVTNYALTCLVLGFVFAGAAIARTSKPVGASIVVEKLLSRFVFFSIGICYLVNFVMHGLFGELSARFIGWPDSPFQFEVATASLGFAVVGFIAARRSFDARLVAVVGPTFFLLGAAAGHVYQMVTTHNFAPGNAGIVFYMDIAIPVVGFVLLWLDRRYAANTAAR